MKEDKKKALYNSVMTSVAKQVKKTLRESFSDMNNSQKKSLNESILNHVAREVKKTLNENYNEVNIKYEEIRDAVREWAGNNMNSSGYDTYADFCNNMRAMIAYGNDPLVDACYNDIVDEFPDVDPDAENEILKDIICNVLAEEAQYYLDTADPEGFDDYDPYSDADYN